MILLFFIGLLTLPSSGRTEEKDVGPIVTCPSGRVRGRHSDMNGMQWEEFFGIPFAKPPVGNLRFRAPEPHEGWEGVRDGTAHRERCYAMQFTLDYGIRSEIRGTADNPSEDCLFLNIYVPHSVAEAKKGPKAVMVWFYGGAYILGDTVTYDGMVLSSMNDVIVVTVAYRIGPLGFFTTGDSEAPGNYGLLDQQMALRWVHENIEAFGGDPKRVTIFGESAGSASVSFQVLNPTSRQYFQRAISHSGSAFDGWLTTEFNLAVTNSFTEELNCPTGDSATRMKCLREADAEMIHNKTNYNTMDGLKWLPVVDGAMVIDDPLKLLEGGEGSEIDYLMGVNSVEAVSLPEMLIEKTLEADNKTVNPDALLDAVFESAVQMLRFPNKPKIRQVIQEAYFNNIKHEKSDCITAMQDFFNAAFMHAGLLTSAKGHARNGGKVYTYHFTHASSVSLMKLFMDVELQTKGALHADDIMYTFGLPYSPSLNKDIFHFTPEEEELSLTFMRLIAHFAKTGNPNTDNEVWPVWNEEKQNYLEIKGQPEVRSHFLEGKASFWLDELPSVLEAIRQEAAGPEVICPSGSVRGRRGDTKGMRWEEFFGIPFAKPPVGDLRFRAPEPHEGWAGVRDGTAHRERCYGALMYPELGFRSNVVGRAEECSEDCLFLDVYVPLSVEQAKKSPKTVMVWFYGGGFLFGETVSYDGMVLSSANDVIVVTVAYRIGPLGFFTIGDSEAPGNYGLLDQQMALRWVHENIEAFGGDPKRVTIFGESAGSASVSFQVLNPISRQYFQRAISFSGSAFDAWAVPRALKASSKNLTETVGCSSNSANSLKCMQKADIEQIYNNTDYNMLDPGFAFRWLPVVDGIMVKDEPRKLLESGEGSDIDYMMGTTADEGLFAAEMIVKTLLEEDGNSVNPDRFHETFLAVSVGTGLIPNNSAAIRAVENKYFYTLKYEKEDCISALNKFFSDGYMRSGTALNSREHNKNKGNVHVFKFSYVSPVSLLTVMMNLTTETEGTGHGDDIPYIFGYPLNPDVPAQTYKYGEAEKTMTRIFMELFTNFAKTGNPSTEKIDWPAWDSIEEKYLDIKIPPEIKSKFMEGREALWLDDMPSFAPDPYDEP